LPELRWREDELVHRFYGPSALGELERRFLEAIESLMRPGDRVLDAGCGSGRLFTYDVRGRASLIVGVDLSSDVAQNPNIDWPLRASLTALPFASETFDLIICKHVLEHLAEPEPAFRELARVLRPQGRLLVLTPHRFHYVPLLAAPLPCSGWSPAAAASRRWRFTPPSIEPTRPAACDGSLGRPAYGSPCCACSRRRPSTWPSTLWPSPWAWPTSGWSIDSRRWRRCG